jgi:hypothetical protein
MPGASDKSVDPECDLRRCSKNGGLFDHGARHLVAAKSPLVLYKAFIVSLKKQAFISPCSNKYTFRWYEQTTPDEAQMDLMCLQVSVAQAT